MDAEDEDDDEEDDALHGAVVSSTRNPSSSAFASKFQSLTASSISPNKRPLSAPPRSNSGKHLLLPHYASQSQARPHLRAAPSLSSLSTTKRNGVTVTSPPTSGKNSPNLAGSSRKRAGTALGVPKPSRMPADGHVARTAEEAGGYVALADIKVIKKNFFIHLFLY